MAMFYELIATNHTSIQEIEPMKFNRKNSHSVAKEIQKMKLVLYVIALALIPFSAKIVDAAQSGIHGFQAEYSIQYGDSVLGKASRTVSNEGDGIFVSTFDVVPGQLLVLFGESAYRQQSVFKVRESRATSIAFEITNNKNKGSDSAKFDWSAGKIELGNGKRLQMPEGEVYDFESWHASLMIADPQELDGQIISIVERDKLRTYLYESAQPEVLDIQGYPVNSVRVKLQDVDNWERGYTVWVVTAYRNIPVRIEKHKKGRTLKFELQALNWTE